DDETRGLLDGVGAWVEAGQKTTALEAFVKPDAPIVAASHYEYFATRAGRERFVRAVESAPAPLYALVWADDLAAAKRYIEDARLSVGRVTPLPLPFFSQRGRLGMMLVEVLRPTSEEGRTALEAFWRSAPYPDSDYRAEIVALNAPARMRAGERAELRFRVRNA